MVHIREGWLVLNHVRSNTDGKKRVMYGHFSEMAYLWFASLDNFFVFDAHKKLEDNRLQLFSQKSVQKWIISVVSE